jgi:hypothetical protein
MHAARQTRSTGLDKVSNGRLLPKSVDMRSAGGRRYRYLVSAYSNEIGTELTEPEKALVRQVSSLQLRIEQLQVRVVRGEDVSADEVIRLSSEHRRLLTALTGKAEKAKPAASTSLHDYIAEHYGRATDAAEADEPA